MLYDAGNLTLNLAEEALADGWMLKDATPWNILYSGGRAVFCDILSFEPKSRSGIWCAYAQFQRTFLLPLYAYARHAWPVHASFLELRDGIAPSTLEPVVRGWRRWAPFELQTIILPTKLALGVAERRDHASVVAPMMATIDNQKLSDFIFRRSFLRLQDQLAAVRPPVRKSSQWSNYANNLQHYDSSDREIKSAFVRSALSQTGAGSVLDIGCNVGEYSFMAATQGAAVTAADFDVAALETLYERVKRDHLPITPVVLNFARPTPAVGWNNREVDSFLDRARGRFRVVMMLGLLHHLIVTERIPLKFIVEVIFELESAFLLIEWISPQDTRFRQIANTHGDLYQNLTEVFFEGILAAHYKILERVPLRTKTRVLYFCKRR
jgi:SAM-dependent methyltransferase